MKKLYKIFKRIVDFLIALVLFIILLPVMLVVAIAIKIDSKGPIFFKQKRSGKNNKIFNMYKFRSMAVSNDVLNFNEADKTTRVGKFIRKTSLDEIPQLINIIKGDMSFIGPRPWITEYSKYFTEEQFHRLDVLPGMTGLAQCEGRNGISIIEKINFDLKYVKSISLKMDLYIIFKTVYTVFSAKNAVGNKDIIRNELEDLKHQFSEKNKTIKGKKIKNSSNEIEEVREEVYA